MAGDVVDVPQAQSVDFVSFGVAAEPAAVEQQVWSAGEAGQQRDAVALEIAAVGSAGDAELQERHGADVAADLAFDAGFLAGALAGQQAAVKPGGEQVLRRAIAADQGGTDDILTVRLPKRTGAQSRKIEIKS